MRQHIVFRTARPRLQRGLARELRPIWAALLGVLSAGLGCGKGETILTGIPQDAGAQPDAAVASAALPGVPLEHDVSTHGVAASDVRGQRVLELIGALCVDCPRVDGEGDTPLVDVGALIASGQIVPGFSEASPLLYELSSAPRRNERLGVGELALLSQWIDALEVDVPPCDALPGMSLDEVFAAVARDIEALDAEQRRFARYVALTPASNAGLCGAALERRRQALSAAVNGTSRADTIAVPEPIDPARVLYRLDLRDYAWDRAIDLDGDGASDFADAWLAIVNGAAPYAVEFSGPEADVVRRKARVAVPLLPANALIAAVANGDLYYALTDAREALTPGMAACSISGSNENLEAGIWVGTAPHDREAQACRNAPGQGGAAFWAFQDADNQDSESIFEDPIGWNGAHWQMIFELPNGLQAYAIQEERSREVQLSTTVPNHTYCGRRVCPELELSGCPACHGGGLLPLLEQLRNFVVDNAPIFDDQTVDDVLVMYRPQAELDALIAADSHVHAVALGRAGLTPPMADAVSRVAHGFELNPLTAIRAAAELGVDVRRLRQELPRMGSRLSALEEEENGSIDRASFTEVFGATLCAVHEGSNNRPAACP